MPYWTLEAGHPGEETRINVSWYDEHGTRHWHTIIIGVQSQDAPRILDIKVDGVSVVEMRSDCPSDGIEALPCPFCGAPAVAFVYARFSKLPWKIGCENRHILEQQFETADLARAAWKGNRGVEGPSKGPASVPGSREPPA